MIKHPLKINRPGARVPKIHPAYQRGWYKRFRQLAERAIKVKK